MISIDGVAPRAVGWATMPQLCRLANEGGATFAARTVTPPLTLPAHTSLLRGVTPDRHGIVTNEATSLAADGPGEVAPSFLRLAADHGRTTAVVTSWRPMLVPIEDGAVTHLRLVDGGYDPDDDEVTTADAIDLLGRRSPDLSFVYLIGPDLAGHAAGWDSEAYRMALSRADERLGRIVAAAGPDTAVVVTTDHGGEGTGHAAETRATMETFVVVRSGRVPPRTVFEDVSIVDVTPTVAELCGITPDPGWTGSSLVGRGRPLNQWLLDMVKRLAEHDYGERVDILSHSLQTAAAAKADGGDDALVVAALFHDIGHLLRPATKWGVPDHAEIGAAFLQHWFGPAVTEPIRLHVAAKRYLTATDPSYLDQLSPASMATLEQQGGPYGSAEAEAFAALPGSEHAVRLRRHDDGGKIPGQEVLGLEAYRPLIDSVLDAAPIPASWARDACRCPRCRDEQNGQHLIDAADLVGWVTTGSRRAGDTWTIDLRHERGATHRVSLPWPTGRAAADRAPSVVAWPAGHADRLRPGASDLVEFSTDLAADGIALIGGRGTAPGTVLEVAGELGFVRTTNYGDLFDVRTEAAPINLAYTNAALPLHTDNPYRDPVPTVQLLHCLVAAGTGGASIFADGFGAAARFRDIDPAGFELLTTTPVRFLFRDPTVVLTAEVPIIDVDARGEVRRITVNNRSMLAVDLGPRTEDFYRAYVRFSELLADPGNTITFELAPGEIVGFDNRRVLHARTGFANTGARHLQGCYLDIDAVRSTAMLARGDDVPIAADPLGR